MSENKVKKFVYSKVPILRWFPNYQKLDCVGDLIAGFTIGLTMMPQSIAYAALAGLTAQYGLYSSFIGSFIYVIFGTIREVSIGPTSLMALLSVEYTRDLPVEFMILLCFLAGCMELLMGILKLGFLIDFISVPVISGFQSAMSIIIIVSQLKTLFGIRFRSKGFVDNIRQLIVHFPEIQLGDTILGIFCIVFLLSLRKLKDVKISKNRSINRVLWFVSISRNALAVLICATVAFVFESNTGTTPFKLSGNVEPGLPSFQAPKFSSQVGNETYTFPEMCSKLGSGIIVVPLFSVIANVAIAKVFSSGKSVDATQEMITLGLCNIFGSFVKSMPTCGAFTRSAVSNASGVRTPLAGLYSGILILLALTFLTPYFYFIPKSTLSAILICAVMFMIDWKILKPLWKFNKFDFFVTASTFFVILIHSMGMGLLVGVLINFANLMRLWARPKINSENCKNEIGQEYLLITPNLSLLFPAVDFLRSEISKIAILKENEHKPVVIDCRYFLSFDYSAAKGLEAINRDFEVRYQQLIFLNVNPNIKQNIDCNIDSKKIKYCDSMIELSEYLNNEKTDISRDATYPLLTDKNDSEMYQIKIKSVDGKIAIEEEDDYEERLDEEIEEEICIRPDRRYSADRRCSIDRRCSVPK